MMESMPSWVLERWKVRSSRSSLRDAQARTPTLNALGCYVRSTFASLHPSNAHLHMLTIFYCVDQSRKRGTLESDLLLSTFADTNLATMTPAQLKQYDLFLDENDWDIYYWVTQEPSQTSRETAEGAGPDAATPAAQGKAQEEDKDIWRQDKPRSGEWAQTVGAFKPAYRPVPSRWKNSEILSLLRKHVLERSAGGVHEDLEAKVEGQGLQQSVKGTGGGGMGFMPEVKNFDV